MISGTFHPTGQEWRYFSREKALIHTLHLAQLPASRTGDTVEIASTAPSSNNNGYSQPPLQMPPGSGEGGGIANLLYTTNTLSTCFGSVGPGQQVLTKRQMIVQFGVWTDARKEILMTPQEDGWFMIHAEYISAEQASLVDNGGNYSDGTKMFSQANSFAGSLHRGTGANITTFGKTLSIVQGAYPFASPTWNPPINPIIWNPNFYLSTITSDNITLIYEGIKDVPFYGVVVNNSNPSISFDMTMWLFKIADL